MKVTKATDYAITALIYIAQHGEGRLVMRNEIADKCNIPNYFLGRILQVLAKSDILKSERGQKGGFYLAKTPEEITYYDIIVALKDQDVFLIDCIEENKCSCGNLASDCKSVAVWRSIQHEFVGLLKKHTLAECI